MCLWIKIELNLLIIVILFIHLYFVSFFVRAHTNVLLLKFKHKTEQQKKRQINKDTKKYLRRMSIEEKGKWVILINFILFPIGLIVYNAMTFETQNFLVEYVNPVQGSCPENYHFRNDGFCYERNCEGDMPCERVSSYCPLNKQRKLDDGKDKYCYTKVFYVNPSEPICPEAFYRSGDICLPLNVKLDQHEMAKVPLKCADHKVLKNHKCFSVNETCSSDDGKSCVKQEL